MHRIDFHAARILAVRLDSCETVEEAKALAKDMRGALKGQTGKIVAVADFRKAHVFSAEVSEVFVEILKADNPLIERSAHVLAKGSNVFAMQIERMVREAGSTNRKVFREVDDALAYVADALTQPHKQWLLEWFAQP
jgi:hypothetical protein